MRSKHSKSITKSAANRRATRRELERILDVDARDKRPGTPAHQVLAKNPSRSEIERRIREIDLGNERGVDAFAALKKM